MNDPQSLYVDQRRTVDAALASGSWPAGIAEVADAKLRRIERTPADDARLSEMVGEAIER